MDIHTLCLLVMRKLLQAIVVSAMYCSCLIGLLNITLWLTVYTVERVDQNGTKYTELLKWFHFETPNERIQAIFQFLRSHEPLPFWAAISS